MKKVFVCFLLLFVAIGMTFSQEVDDWNWGGLVRFKPLVTVVGFLAGALIGAPVFDFAVDWVPYVTPSIGIPVGVEIISIGGIFGFGIFTGIEAVPVRHMEKSGLFLTAVAGPVFILQRVFAFGRADIGYQIVTNGGFVFTPAIGIKYDSYAVLSSNSPIAFHFMLDLGFAYRKR